MRNPRDLGNGVARHAVRRVATTVAGAVLVGMAVTAPASALPSQVDGRCGTYICVYTAHHNRFVQDITVETRDGLSGQLRSYWGDFRSPRVNAARARWAVGAEKSAPLVCGALVRDGRQIEEVCVTI
ncbi:hypothetical protein [Streptomyces sp. SID3212]|uniref:hypothetical protein n=1 Tax=Streptomyces sp. SID3212 TaxID=2690259 RepID=UPI001F2A1F3E|nr:hypothetical protein [Streptomyces sp. SID3212]